MTHTRRLFIVLLSVCASIVVIAAALAGVIALWQPTPLASLLPSDWTVAFLRNATDEDVLALSELYPGIFVPKLGPAMDIGIVRMDEGTLGWIASPVPYAPIKDPNVMVGRQRVLASDDRIETLLKRKYRSLASAESFRMLSRGIGGDARLLYMDEGSISDLGNARRLFPGIAGTGAMLLARSTDTVRLRVLGDTPAVPPSASTIAMTTPLPDLLVQTENPQVALDAILSTYPVAERPAILGRLQKQIRGAIPGEWSWTYDMLPLLDGALTVQTKTGTGTTAFLAQGTARDGTAAEKILHSLHEAFRASLPGTAERRVLDHGIVSTVLGSGNGVTERMWEAGGFTLRETRDTGNNAVFVTGVNGRRFIIGNSLPWAEQVLTGTGEAHDVPPGMVRGIVSIARLRSFLSTAADSPFFSFVRTSVDNASHAAWAVSRENGVIDLTLRTR